MIRFIYQYDKLLLDLCMSMVDQDQNQELMHEMELFLYLLNEISRFMLIIESRKSLVDLILWLQLD